MQYRCIDSTIIDVFICVMSVWSGKAVAFDPKIIMFRERKIFALSIFAYVTVRDA